MHTPRQHDERSTPTIDEVITDEYIYHFAVVDNRITAVTRYDADDFIECQPGETFSSDYDIDRICFDAGVRSNFDRMFDEYIDQAIDEAHMIYEGERYLHQPVDQRPFIGPDPDIPFGPC